MHLVRFILKAVRPDSHHGRSEQKNFLSLQNMESQAIHLPSATFVADVSIIPDPHEVQDRQHAVTGAQNNIHHEQYAHCGAKSQHHEPGTRCQRLQTPLQRRVERRELDSQKGLGANALMHANIISITTFNLTNQHIIFFRQLFPSTSN
jgi:hypothetical protein